MAARQRPLSEVSPVAQRRNSPSWSPNLSKDGGNGDSSPFEMSPTNNPTSNSPRLFWKGRDTTSPQRPASENSAPYDPAIPLSPSKRSSVENLKNSSRVKNSSLMFAREQKDGYDPANVRSLDRPLATGRPLGGQFQRNSPTAPNEDARRQLPSQMSASKNNNPDSNSPRRFGSPLGNSAYSGSPGKNQTTPTKSSMSKGGRYSGRITSFDPASDIYSDGESGTVDDSQLDRSPNRHAKSVTFDAAPPQINEYEMTTPVPSSVASSSREGSQDSGEDDEDESFEHNSSMVDDSFDASLEDTAKTPVVLPEDWRFMNPDNSNDDLLHGGEDDPFSDDYGSPDRDPTPDSVQQPQPLRPRLESMDSNGERRPLPPLPEPTPDGSPEHHTSTLSAFEQGNSPNREYPSPLRPASCSKADIVSFGNGSMSLEDRLRLMMTRDREGSPSEMDKQRERRMRRAGARDRRIDREGEGGDNTLSLMSGGSDREMSPDMSSTPPRISRESILRDIKSEDVGANDISQLSESARSPSPMPLDPDVPIPSLESQPELDDRDVIVKDETEHEINLYDIPEYRPDDDEYHRDSPTRSNQDGNEDDGSSYSREDNHVDRYESPDRATPVPQNHHNTYDEISYKESSPVSNGDGNDDHGLDAEILNYAERSISPIEGSSTIASHFNMESIRKSLNRPETPEQKDADSQYVEGQEDRDTPPTPQSVIRHPLSDSPEPSAIPEPMATIKAPSSELKTKPSLTPADVETMAATRRKVSGQDEPPQPSIREYEREDESTFIAPGNRTEVDDDTITSLPGLQQEHPPTMEQQRQSSLVKLDIPVGSNDEGLGVGLSEEFDRVIEAEKVAFELSLAQLSYSSLHPAQRHHHPNGRRSPADTLAANPELDSQQKSAANSFMNRQRGYLMRQNTKVIYASSRPNDEPAPPGAEGADNARRANEVSASPRKASQQTWTVEPWNGKPRRQSIKLPGTVPRKKVPDEPVPPLPGHESNAKEATGQRESLGSRIEEPEDGEERGRLFVKVVGVKNLDLPLPRNEVSHFALTLDNGIHCVTTAWLELGNSAPIGQEFELVVLNELEFQLTLQMKLEPPKPKVQPAQAKPQKPQKTSAFSRVFASPKKRREMELQQQMEAEKQQKAAAASQAANQDPWEKLRKLAADDGSFARSYVSLNDYEGQAFGRPLTVDVTCFNEWAVDETVNSMKSKKSGVAASAGSGVKRLPPYHIGSLELQLLYVPKPKGATDEDMPKSMNACIREMREADNTASRNWEGYLSQQGGDCPYWRRRLFKLQGTKLTAYHEVTRQPRATINLAKASKLIDDKSILTQKETSAKGGGRRKSAFAEEEEGYMFVEEGFRIRFANGEVIDFYADSAAEKEGWMKVLEETVGKGYSAGSGKSRGWTDLVMKREKSISAKKEAADSRMSKAPMRHGPAHHPPHSHAGAAPSAPPRPPGREAMNSPPMKRPMAPPPKPRHQHHQSQPQAGLQGQSSRHQKARSLIF